MGVMPGITSVSIHRYTKPL